MKKRDIIDCRLIKDKSGNSKGYAYLDFITPEAAKESLYMNGEMIKGKKLMVALSEPPKITRDDRNTLFVNNLPYSVTEKMLTEAMPDFVSYIISLNYNIYWVFFFIKKKDSIIEIRIIKDHNDRPKGFGYIEFKNQVNENI